MADRFENFKDFAAELQPEVDYRIRSEDRGTSVIIIAPHGGSIERAVAATDRAAEPVTFRATNASVSHHRDAAPRVVGPEPCR